MKSLFNNMFIKSPKKNILEGNSFEDFFKFRNILFKHAAMYYLEQLIYGLHSKNPKIRKRYFFRHIYNLAKILLEDKLAENKKIIDFKKKFEILTNQVNESERQLRLTKSKLDQTKQSLENSRKELNDKLLPEAAELKNKLNESEDSKRILENKNQTLEKEKLETEQKLQESEEKATQLELTKKKEEFEKIKLELSESKNTLEQKKQLKEEAVTLSNEKSQQIEEIKDIHQKESHKLNGEIAANVAKITIVTDLF